MAATATLNTLHDSVSAERLAAHLQWFSHVRRDTGGPGEDAAATYIREQLERDGVPVHVHEFDAYLSYPRSATLRAVSGPPTEYPALTHSFAAATGPGGLRGRLVHVHPSRLADAAGAIALVDGLATPVTILQASRAACAGVVFANEDRVIHNMIGTTIWGTPGLDQLDRLPRIPVVSVNRESGGALKAALAGGAALEVTLTTVVDTGWTRSRLPEVRIPGTRDPETFCLIGGHYCAWDVGITDNATGDASLLEVARILWQFRDRLGRGVRVCWWPGHSHGRYSGSTWYADTFFTDLAEGCIAYQNVDSPGVKGATRYVARHTCAEVERFCRFVIEQVTGQPNAPVHRPSRAADQSFLANGVPSYSAYPFLPEDHPDRRPWTGGSANAWWWHTDEDVLDKADVPILVQDTRVALAALLELSTTPILPLDYEPLGREIRELISAIQKKAGAHADLSPALSEAERFIRAAAALQDAAATAAHDPERARRINGLLMRLGRVLNPVVYSQGGRFQHDPAEWSPIMRATSQYSLPGLARASALPTLEHQSGYGFLAAQVLRERNRVVTALREAIRCIEESGVAHVG